MEEWTKEEIGVGAAIAAGSQGEKGKRALLVHKPSNKEKDKINLNPTIKRDEGDV